MSSRIFAIVPCAFLFMACAACAGPELHGTPWSHMGQGSFSLATTFAEGLYEADVKVIGSSGPLVPSLGKDTAKLTTKYGGNLKLEYFVTDNWTLGGGVSFTHLDPSPIRPLTAVIAGDEFDSLRYLFLTRYWFDPLGEEGRWRPFLSLILSYIPELKLNATVLYPTGDFERIRIDGDSYATLGMSGGVSYLIWDDFSVDLGLYLETSLGHSVGTILLTPPGGGGPGTLEFQVDTTIVFAFFGFTFFF